MRRIASQSALASRQHVNPLPAATTKKTITRMFTLLVAASGTLLTACAESPTEGAAKQAPALNRTGGGNGNSYTISQVTVGDTIVTRFVVGTNTTAPATFNIGNSSKIDFPMASGSICDPATSSYGPGTWDSDCSAATTPVEITAKSWVNAQGKLATDFQPALRFVPGLRRSVTLYLRDATLAANTNILFCGAGGCVDEAAADPSLVTRFDAPNGFAYRTIKHFSGYMVSVGVTDGGEADQNGEIQ